MTPSRNFLLASVSGVALALSAPALMAADLSVRPVMMTKAPAFMPPPPNPWTFWVEGGLQAVTGDDTHVYGLDPAFGTPAKKWGWSGAAAFDYRLDPTWHVSGAFRYGQNRTRTSSGNPRAQFGVPLAICPDTTDSDTNCTTAQTIKGTGQANRNEHNWVADFMIGRDLGLGGSSQVKFGLRVAEIRGTTTGSASFGVPTNTNTTNTVAHTRSFEQKNRFLGAGPRLAIEGSAPVGGGWFIDYMGGVAALYGHRSVEQTVGNVSGGAFCFSGCPSGFSSSSTQGAIDDGFTFNADAMVGLGYALTPNAKISLNYRVDAYFNAMRVIDANNNVANVNRIYHGPSLRLTVNY